MYNFYILNGFFSEVVTIDISNLVKKNEEKLSNTDITIAEEILKNGLDYSISINDFAQKCFTSRTSVLRFAKKLGFSGYSQLKYYVNDNEKEDSYNQDDDLAELYKKIKKCDKIFIYGNGGYEKIIKSALKMYLLEIGILAEVYSGGEEMKAFTGKMLENSGVFIVDFNDNSYSKQLIFQIASSDCLKVLIGRAYDRASNVDYNIYFTEQTNDTRLMSPYIKRLEELFKLYRKADNDIN